MSPILLGAKQSHGDSQLFHQTLYNQLSRVSRPTGSHHFWDREAASPVTANPNTESSMNNFIESSASKGTTRRWKFKQKKKKEILYHLYVLSKILVQIQGGKKGESERVKTWNALE